MILEEKELQDLARKKLDYLVRVRFQKSIPFNEIGANIIWQTINNDVTDKLNDLKVFFTRINLSERRKQLQEIDWTSFEKFLAGEIDEEDLTVRTYETYGIYLERDFEAELKNYQYHHRNTQDDLAVFCGFLGWKGFLKRIAVSKYIPSPESYAPENRSIIHPHFEDETQIRDKEDKYNKDLQKDEQLSKTFRSKGPLDDEAERLLSFEPFMHRVLDFWEGIYFSKPNITQGYFENWVDYMLQCYKTHHYPRSFINEKKKWNQYNLGFMSIFE